MTWMFDTDIMIHLVNRKPGYERIARRMSGRSPGELWLSAITVSELIFGAANGEFRKENEAALEDLFDLFEFRRREPIFHPALASPAAHEHGSSNGATATCLPARKMSATSSSGRASTSDRPAVINSAKAR